MSGEGLSGAVADDRAHQERAARDGFRDRAFPTLNAARAAGALMVVLTHAAFNTGEINHGWVGAALARFDFGVTIFFVLSGFLLSRPWFLTAALGRPAPSTRHYLWKRALRILPLYWVVVVVALLADPENRQLGWADWVTNLTLTQLYRPGLLPSSLTQMWSLATEAAFYLLLPLLCWALTWHRAGHRLDVRAVLLRAGVLFVAGVAWQSSVAQVPGSHGHYAQWLPGYLPWFLVGVGFAAVSADLAVRPRAHLLDRLGGDLAGCWVLATAVFAIAASPLAGPRTLLTPDGWEAGPKVVLYAVAGAFYLLPLVFGPERDGWARQQLSGPVVFWLGEVSYGVFAIHMLVLNLVFRVLDVEYFSGRFVTVAAVTLVVSIALATASFYLFERRVLRWKDLRLFARMDAAARPDGPTVR
jgi:peptidoglycan/LPS O-acetylase OafA/YrhL